MKLLFQSFSGTPQRDFLEKDRFIYWGGERASSGTNVETQNQVLGASWETFQGKYKYSVRKAFANTHMKDVFGGRYNGRYAKDAQGKQWEQNDIFYQNLKANQGLFEKFASYVGAQKEQVQTRTTSRQEQASLVEEIGQTAGNGVARLSASDRGSLTVRATTAGTKSAAMGSIRDGESIRILGYQTDSQGNKKAKVQIANGRVGYVMANRVVETAKSGFKSRGRTQERPQEQPKAEKQRESNRSVESASGRNREAVRVLGTTVSQFEAALPFSFRKAYVRQNVPGWEQYAGETSNNKILLDYWTQDNTNSKYAFKHVMKAYKAWQRGTETGGNSQKEVRPSGRLDMSNLNKENFIHNNRPFFQNVINNTNALLVSKYGKSANKLSLEEVTSVFNAEFKIKRGGKIDTNGTHSLNEKGVFPLPEQSLSTWLGVLGLSKPRNLSNVTTNLTTAIQVLAGYKNFSSGRANYKTLFQYPGIKGNPAKEAQLLAGITHGYFYSGNYEGGVPTSHIVSGIARGVPLADIMAGTSYKHGKNRSLLAGRERNLKNGLKLS